MPKAQPGQRKWKRLLKGGVRTAKEQIRTTSQLRAHLSKLAPDDENLANGEAYAYIFQALAYLDKFSEQTAEIQEMIFQLWEISGIDEELNE
jgi:hypothetical protein